MRVIRGMCAGVRHVYVSLEDEVVLVETALPSGQVQGLLEGTGRLVVFRGFGGARGTGYSGMLWTVR